MSPGQAKETKAVLSHNQVKHHVEMYEGAGHGFSERIGRTNQNQTKQAVKAER